MNISGAPALSGLSAFTGALLFKKGAGRVDQPPRGDRSADYPSDSACKRWPVPKPGRTVERGYGPKHKAERLKAKRVVDAGRAYCWRCGGWINPAEPWDLGHDDHDRTRYRGPEHVKCNRSTAARRARRTTRRGRRWRL